MKEIFRPVAFNKKYLISNLGNLKNAKTNKFLKPKIIKGYKIFWLSCGKRRQVKTKPAHRLVIETFVGPCPDGMQCAHLDGNGLNNNLNNLKWCTPKENAMHKFVHKTQKNKISDNDCIEIIKEFCSGSTIENLKDKYSVKKETIKSIIYGIRKNVRVSVLKEKPKSLKQKFRENKINSSSFYYLTVRGATHEQAFNYLKEKKINKNLNFNAFLRNQIGVA